METNSHLEYERPNSDLEGVTSSCRSDVIFMGDNLLACNTNI